MEAGRERGREEVKTKKQQEEREGWGWGGEQSKSGLVPQSCQRAAQRLVITAFEMTMA